MPTATNPPRCPHRVATTPIHWLVVTLVSLVGVTTATVSLDGKEIDYRFVVPAGHMQPWPDDEAEILITPPATSRIAAKWRTNLASDREEKEPEITPAAEDKLPGPAIEVPKEKVEELIVPQMIDNVPTQPAVDNAPQPNECYLAPPLSASSVDIALPDGELPTDIAAQCAMQNPPVGDARLMGAWAGTEFHWSATCLCHRPLYFEEINAERYGYTVSYTLQPVISAARFFAAIPALPYKMVVERPRDCIYTLGHYRPGSCAPRRCNHLPWKLTAGVVETGFIAGLILLIP